MADRQKMIAVCLSQAHSFLNTGFLVELSRAAAENDYRVGVFNSSLDFYWYQKDNPAPRAGYRAIRYELFDAVIIIYHSFHDEGLANEIIDGARRHNVPVFIAGADIPGCYTILNDYENSFKSVIRHVIRDHGVRDTFFIAGIKNEQNSEDRLRCYREVLEEAGLPFGPEQLAYGNYWAKSARDIVRKLIRTREKLPRAIFCANDTMAISVCDTLREEGFSVPEDVIVTGFDGSPAAYMIRPHLTTCSDDPRGLARTILEMLEDIRQGGDPSRKVIHTFRPVLAGSCGCPDEENDRYDPLVVYRRSVALNDHENDLYHKVEQMLMQRNSDSLLNMLSLAILPHSFICLNKRFLGIYSGIDYASDHLEEDIVMIPYRERDEDPAIVPCRLSDLLPPESDVPSMTVFNTIHTGTVVCGFFGAYTENLEEDAQLIKRLSDVLNMVFTIQLGNARQQMLIHHLDNSLYLDPVTGFSNLRGLTRWFDEYTAEENNHFRPLALSVYSIYRYNYIYENYGMNETEDIVRLVATRLTSANPDALAVARISGDQFVVVDSGEDPEEISRIINRTTGDFFRQIESYNSVSTRQYYIEVNAGCTVMEAGWQEATLENLIRLALSELYLNRMRNTSTRAASKTNISATEFYSAFNLLMEKNLFKFHFQPIVDARNGQIFAYEALMRTDSLINLTPLEILSTAREYNRLYDVERATFFGIMERYVRDYSRFNGCKVFINTIPGYFLSENDCLAIREQFESYLDCFVFEITEQDSTTEEELTRLKRLCKTGDCARIAIDDYGTGHSNIVNVLRYAPQIIKIDRELVSGIPNDSNKQLFVRNTIDFAHQNGIHALAEGVETSEELRTVIDFGVDLVQGFYTGRPSEHPQQSINDAVRQEILSENLLRARFDRNSRVYTPEKDETVNLVDLAMRQYTYVQIANSGITLVGLEKQSVDLVIRIAENIETVLTLDHVNLKGVNEPVIQLGDRSRVTLVAVGNNLLNKDGIRVPPTASLTLQGGGELRIMNTRNYSVGIGANYNDAYGTIVVDMAGSLSVQSSGDKVVCIGGGRSAGDGITLIRGSCHLSANGISVIGLGSSSGDADINILNATVTAHIEGNDALGIGSLSGEARILSTGELTVTVDSERSTGLGTMTGSGELRLDGGSASVITHCDAGACIGTFSGEFSSRIRGASVRIHGEGNRVAGFGSPDGACDTRIESGEVQGEILAGERMLLGNEHSRVVITGGNVRIYPEGRQCPVGPAGEPLYYITPKADHFEQTFRDRRGAWTYTADRNPEGLLGVWVPHAPT